LHEVAQRLIERTDEFARLLTLEGGKPLVENRDEIAVGSLFRYYANLAERAGAE